MRALDFCRLLLLMGYGTVIGLVNPIVKTSVFWKTLISHIGSLLLSDIIPARALNAEYGLDYGMKNDYVPAKAGDGGQGTFGAVSPSNWKVAGTSPVGRTSWPGASNGGDEPWFAEAISTVSLDLTKAEETLKAFTKEAADFKIAAFCKENKDEDSKKAMDQLVGSMGYDKFLESSAGQLKKAYEKLKGTGRKRRKRRRSKHENCTFAKHRLFLYFGAFVPGG
jgi:hypothetical protein